MQPLPQLDRGLVTDDISVAINLSADDKFEAGNSDYVDATSKNDIE